VDYFKVHHILKRSEGKIFFKQKKVLKKTFFTQNFLKKCSFLLVQGRAKEIANIAEKTYAISRIRGYRSGLAQE
jgi:hypothetical protein